jgi:Icc-related predicted phosphoesterase
LKIQFFSDIHADWKALERLIEVEADYYFCAGDLVSWSRGLERAGDILKQRAGKVMVIPGNHETAADIQRFCRTYGFEDMHGRTLHLGDFHLAALGYSNPTPFDTPGEYSEDELAARLESFASLHPLILVCHCPPKDTPLDAGHGGRHYGSTAVASFIAQHSPRYFFCGHIHEAEGVQATLGDRTIGVNLGKRGFLFEGSMIHSA